MTAAQGKAPAPFWRRRKVQAAAVVLVLALIWLASYLEYLPVAREARESEALTAARDEVIRLSGIAPREPLTIRTTAAAERLIVTLPADTRMRVPDDAEFRAQARQDAAELAGLTDGRNTIIEAQPGPAEGVTLQLAFDGSGNGALQWHRLSDDGRMVWRVTAIDAPLTVTVDLDAAAGADAAASMMLSRPDAAAWIGQAEFVLAAGDTLRLDVVRRTDASGAAPAVVQLPGEASVLLLGAVELGSETDPGELDTYRIACAAGGRRYLWSSLLWTVRRGDCTPRRLAVRAFDLQTGAVSIGRRAFFQGFGDADSARILTKMTSNWVLNLVMVAVAGVVGTWVRSQFKKQKSPRTPSSRTGARTARTQPRRPRSGGNPPREV